MGIEIYLIGVWQLLGGSLQPSPSAQMVIYSISVVFQLGDQVVGSFSISSPVEKSFPFHDHKFLKSCAILGGHQVSQLCTKLCWIFHFVSAWLLFRVEVSFIFPWLYFFSGASFGESMPPGQRSQLHCWCLLSSLLLLLQMVFSWGWLMWTYFGFISF